MKRTSWSAVLALAAAALAGPGALPAAAATSGTPVHRHAAIGGTAPVSQDASTSRAGKRANAGAAAAARQHAKLSQVAGSAAVAETILGNAPAGPSELFTGVADQPLSGGLPGSSAANPPAFTVTNPALLPPGVAVSGTGLVHGIPTADGTYVAGVSACGPSGCTPGTLTFTIAPDQAPCDNQPGGGQPGGRQPGGATVKVRAGGNAVEGVRLCDHGRAGPDPSRG